MTTTQTGIAIADFLLARLDEDWEIAYGAEPSPWRMGEARGGIEGGEVLGRHGNKAADCYYSGTLGHVLHFDPTRILARIEATRAVVRRCAGVDYGMPSTFLAHGILEDLAAAYSNHPDYREAWKS